MVRRTLVASVVATMLMSAVSLPTASAADSAVLQGSITRLYRAYFKRAPDLGGLSYWIGQLQRGLPLGAVSSSFAASHEFRATYGGLDDGQFVRLVYRNVLDRSPDSGGYSFWLGRLRSGRVTRGGVMTGFSESSEFVRLTHTTPPRPSTSFGDGQHHIRAGSWRNVSNGDYCYWARLRGFSGETKDIIANNIATEGRSIVSTGANDVTFETYDCGTWVPDVGPITLSPTSRFAGGTFRVGRDLAPGTWRANGGVGGSCYWERLHGFSGAFYELIANAYGTVRPTVTISSTDGGFSSSDCGTWTKVG